MNRRQFLACTAGAAAALHAAPAGGPFAIVLGTAQDGGYPQAGCKKNCCKGAWGDAAKRRDVASLGIVDPDSGQRWFI